MPETMGNEDKPVSQDDKDEPEESTTTIGELSSAEIEALLNVKPGRIEQERPMPLFQICLQTCMFHANRQLSPLGNEEYVTNRLATILGILDIGDIPYDIIKPVLSRMGPSQLLAVEQNSPHIQLESDELWESILRHTFSEQEVQELKVRRKGDVRQQYYSLLDARRQRLKKTSQKVKAQYEALEREKAQKRIVTLDIFEDPMEAQRRKKRLLQQSSASALKKMSVVKRARIESMSNPIFSSDNTKITSTSMPTIEPMSHEEADRRRQERLNQRISEKQKHPKSCDISSVAVTLPTSHISPKVPMKFPAQTGQAQPQLSFFNGLSSHKSKLQTQPTTRDARQVASPLLPSKRVHKRP
ncbi:RNA polymerase II transcription factor SIII subunit A-domain-containing protein [Lipomyces tetrasporus]|uniref:Elongin-A n=1 Tax=Lipomyces tetrasporus TaxID=54092 RepID=A0AAD7QTF3_9ASCO|nr:RNA polymerase II transcription factor SIII subunit A-domain-containing protein [Lipomyces tetrasporus]KAJ8101011.1 RNA polymerase II transcription factor SIII subunit A-domain-containing protein [Lipomyces tetrasporus]